MSHKRGPLERSTFPLRNEGDLPDDYVGKIVLGRVNSKSKAPCGRNCQWAQEKLFLVTEPWSFVCCGCLAQTSFVSECPGYRESLPLQPQWTSEQPRATLASGGTDIGCSCFVWGTVFLVFSPSLSCLILFTEDMPLVSQMYRSPGLPRFLEALT